MQYNVLNRNKRAATLLLLLALLLVPHLLRAQFFDIDNGRKRLTLPFRIVRNMVIVPLTINNKGPYNFILDTGVGIMVITNPKMADSLGGVSQRTIKLYGLGGEECEALVSPNIKITMPGISSHSVSAAILKDDRLDLSNYAGMPIYGLLGYDFFNFLSVRLNFADSTMVVSRPEDAKMLRKSLKVPITIENKEPYMMTHVKLPDGKELDAKMVIDIGAGHPMSLENMLKENGLPQNFIVANLGMGLTGPISGFLSRIPGIDIGHYHLKDVITSFPDEEYLRKRMPITPRDGNIGLGILKRFTVVFDYTNGYMYLKPNSRLKEPFEHDMSGMEYYFMGDNFDRLIVGRIEPGSAADEIGLMKNDQITAINFKSINKLSIDEIDGLFRSHDGRSLLLDVYRGDKLLRMILSLKKRI